MNAAIRTVRIGPPPTLALDRCGSGPLVVFLHGIGGNRRHWADQLAAFGEHFTAAAWDARGYGDSDDPDGPYAFADFSDDLRRVLDRCGARRAHLVGLSLGGRIARDFALRYPERVATLTLCNTHAGFGARSPQEIERFLAERRAPLQAGAEPRDIAAALADRLIGKSAVPGARERLIESVSALRKRSYLLAIAASLQDTGGELERIRAPVHVVTSDEDRLYPPQTARELAARIAGAELSVIPGAGHLSNLEQPQRFNAAVLGFLLRYRDRADPPRDEAAERG